MFEFIIGDVASIQEDYVVLQNNGIGYKIFTSMNSMVKLEMGMKDAMIFTYFVVRDDGVFLYGFTNEEEIEMFKLLLMVTKIGPKIALGVLSTLTPIQIKLAILRKDLEVLCKAPGIGKKTSERMVLELKDRIDKNILTEYNVGEEIVNSDQDEAIQGLVSLGYTRLEVERCIRAIDTSNMGVEEIIRQTLNKLSRG